MNAAPQEQETDGIASRAPGPFAVTDAESGAPAVAAPLTMPGHDCTFYTNESCQCPICQPKIG
jgi:hypothetical protein